MLSVGIDKGTIKEREEDFCSPMTCHKISGYQHCPNSVQYLVKSSVAPRAFFGEQFPLFAFFLVLVWFGFFLFFDFGFFFLVFLLVFFLFSVLWTKKWMTSTPPILFPSTNILARFNIVQHPPSPSLILIPFSFLPSGLCPRTRPCCFSSSSSCWYCRCKWCWC